MHLKITLLALALILAACAGGAPGDAARCQPATPQQLQAINDGLRDIDANNSVSAGWWVQSNDFANVRMVAALIYGPGIKDGTGPGVWAMGGQPNSPAGIFSVGGFAHQFSSWGDASKTDAAITRGADGVAIAEWCAKNK